MTIKFFNKTISLFLVLILITGLFPPFLFSQPSPSPFSEVKGFSSSVFENHFTKADREINPERWLAEAKFGITQAICAWEFTAAKLYDNPDELNKAKNQLTQWSDEELEKRFSQWLIGRFFGKAAEGAFMELSGLFDEAHKNYTWHLDDEGNIVFDSQTGDPLVIRPNDENRAFSHDLILWQNETDEYLKTANKSFNSETAIIFPELLAYIPAELRETMSNVIYETINSQGISLKYEFENIAAREERIFSSRRTRDIWSLRNKSENEAAGIFTNKLINETEASCKKGIEELNSKIEQAGADTGDLALLGEEWLRLYQEQFERGLKAWEDAEERFFIRRIEWEQDSYNLFLEGDETWIKAFYKFEEERQKWELSVKELFEAGEKMFGNISGDFMNMINDAKKEFELNIKMRTEEGVTKVKALIDMYLLCSSAAFSALDNYNFWKNANNETEMENSNNMYTSYLEKASDSRNKIYDNYAELFGSGALKDILSPDASSEDFYLDDYQIALIKAQALVLYWERKTAIAESVMSYAVELTAGRLTEAEGLRAWEESKALYDKALLEYENELIKLNKIGENVHSQLSELNKLAEQMKIEEEKLDKLTSDYATLVSISAGDQQNYYYADLNAKYNILVENYKLFTKTGADAVYKNILEYGIKWEIAEKQDAVNININYLINGGDNFPSLAELENNISKDNVSIINLQLRLAAIDLLNGAFNNSADWYSKVKGLTLTENEKREIFGENLFERLAADYNSISQLIKEKQLEYELNSSEDSSLPPLEIYLAEYNYEFIFCLGLIELYNNYNLLCSFVQEEIWQNSCNSLKILLNNYGLGQLNSALPDPQSICEAINKKSGNFYENASNFIIGFENCFSAIPHWIEYEIDCWKDSLVSYISAYALYNNITPQSNSSSLLLEQEEIIAKFLEMVNNISLQNDLEEFISYSVRRLRTLDYMYQITESYEELLNLSQDEEKHWRQYLLDEHITDEAPFLNIASSRIDGIFADSLYCSVYFTNRVNDSFNLLSDKNITPEENSKYYYYLYSDEVINKIISFSTLNYQCIEFVNAVDAYNYSKLTPDKVNGTLKELKNALEKQEIEYNLAKEKYLKEAVLFNEIGFNYDEQYSKLKQAHNNADQKQFEYEKQDAIQRWASTSYLGTDNIDLVNTENKLLRAQVVLSVLSDLYNSENQPSFDDPKYDELYSAYEQSFSMQMKSLEAIDSLSFAINEEYKKNALLHSQYQLSLLQLGSPDQNMFNSMTVKDGRLAFTDENTDTAELDNFFLTDEQNSISLFEKSLMELSNRMITYFSDPDKYIQWSYAKEFLLSRLINSDEKYKFLKSYYTGIDMFKSDGSIGKLTIKTDTDPFSKTQKYIHEILKEMIDSYGGPLHVKPDIVIANPLNPSELISPSPFFDIYEYLGLTDYYKGSCHDNWNNLSDEEKSDLEYYVILTLMGSNNYSEGFGKISASQLCTIPYRYISSLIASAKNRQGNFFDNLFNGVQLNSMEDINTYALNNISPAYSRLQSQVNNWKTGLEQNLSIIKTDAENYKNSCERLKKLENKKEGDSYITWEDINFSLQAANKMTEDDIADIKSYWKELYKEPDKSIKSVIQALMKLFYWAGNQKVNNQAALEEYWLDTAKIRGENIETYQIAVDSFLTGAIKLDELKNAAKNAYKNNAVTAKHHLDNIHTVLLNNLWMNENNKTNYEAIFNTLGNELVILTEKIIKDRYNAELKAREAEWYQQLIGLIDKYNEWQKTSKQILENGRKDWDAGLQKLETAYKQWNINFQNEYERVSGEWAIAYLAGLEDKEIWLEQAANAYYQTSNDSFLSLIGTEGERLSRFIDTREPISISIDTSQAQILLTELLQSSGIVNMSRAFGSFSNIATVSTPLIKRGMGGFSVWDAAIVKTAASDLARIKNEEIANAESRKLANNARLAADEIVKNLTVGVQTANQKFIDSMDNAFILNGLWNKSGDNYVKDILKGSTLFDSIITKKVTVTGYSNYIMEPVALKTNLDEKHLINLDSIAINMLLTNVYAEVEQISTDIFGDGKEIVGKFFIHTGKIPETIEHEERSDILDARSHLKNPENIETNEKSQEELQAHFEKNFGNNLENNFGNNLEKNFETQQTSGNGKSREEIFIHEGSGELGRLISDLIYWSVIECYGSAELNSPPWEKRMWDDDGSWFKAPSLRLIGTIAGSIIAGIASGGTLGFTGMAISIAVATSSEIMFSTLDVLQGYKTIDEAFVNIGKSLLTNAATSFLSGLFAGIEGAKGIFNQGITNLATNAAGATGNAVFTVATQTAMTALQVFSIGITSSLINGITYNSEDGFGFSNEIFSASMEGLNTNILTTIASVLVSSSLTAINSGFDMSKLTGFNNMNKSDLQRLNNLIGSLAGQGVNLALGNDFTLNILNLGLIPNVKAESGLLELHLGRGGVTMNIGTGGANVSIDNIIHTIKGGMVWNVNTQIGKYIKKQSDEGGNNFDSAVTLRAQYGYGNTVQVGQLWDILKGRTLIDTSAEGEYLAKSKNEDGSKVIYLPNYQQGMSVEEQFLLATIFGHEAYRDGYTTDDNYIETRTATLAHTQMAINMILGKENLFIDENLARDINEYLKAKNNNDMSSFYTYVDSNYDSSADYWKLVFDENMSARFEWDGEYSFDLSAIGISDRMDQLDNQTMLIIYNLSKSELSFDDFKTAVGKFDTLNTIMINFENALNVDPKNTMSINTFKNYESLFLNALRDVGSSGLLAEKAANILQLSGGPHVFANGNGALTCDYGWRAITWGNLDGNFQAHFAWDLGARGNEDNKNMLVAPMDGTLAFEFSQGYGLRLVTYGENNESITYSHSAGSSIRNFVELFSYIGVDLNDNNQLTNIAQNMVIGAMGNTGTLSAGAHVDLIYKVNGVVQNPALFFYKDENRTKYPSTPYAVSMSGLSTDVKFNYTQLTSQQMREMYSYLYNINNLLADNNFLKFYNH